ncbi:CU044_5270 family protein [Streptomyces sp. NPDC050704]|uniref:CU044_5270 family protein n=1 Tax=Streptomyces sp. NPDC050704 TaxID=3157219 RepID=UPI00341DD74A
MNRDVERVRELLPPDADPVGVMDGGVEEGLPARAERELVLLRRTAVADHSTRLVLGPGRRTLLGAAVAVMGAGVLVLNGGLPLPGREGATPAVAVTPPVLTLSPVDGRPADHLLRLAARVEKLPKEHSTGPYQYARTWGWWLNTAGDAPGGAANAAVPTVVETWRRPDGAGRLLSTYGRPIFPNPETEKAARDAGLIAGDGRTDERFGRGGFPDPEGDAWQKVEPFSTDPKKLLKQLKQVNWEGGQLVYGVSDMLGVAARSGPVDPRLRAAALRVLAGATGIKVSTTTTWQGRRAVAVTQEELWKESTSRQSILFSPETGDLLGHEEALLGHPRMLNIRVPATLAVQEFLARGSVDTVNERP